MKTSQCCFIVLSGDLDHPIVFCNTSLGWFDPVFIQDCIKIVWKVAFTGQSFQPKPVGQQQMIQRSVEATEIDTSVKAV